MAEQKDVWILQLTRYFMTHCGYSRIRFITPGQVAQPDPDIWLTNPSARYLVLHLTVMPWAANRARWDQLRRQAASIRDLMHKQGSFLDICLDPQGQDEIGENEAHVSLYPEKTIPNDLKAAFPEIASVLFDVEDPGGQISELSQKIAETEQKDNLAARRRRQQRQQLKGSFSLTFKVCAAICVVVFLVLHLLMHRTGCSAVAAAVVCGAYYKAFINIFHDYWRLLTEGFVHIEFWHLLCNLYSLYVVSRVVEKEYGFVRTMAALLASTVVGNQFVYALDGNVVSVGLSGGIYGLCAIMVLIYQENGYFKVPSFRSNLIAAVGINLAVSFLPGVSLSAHLGGLAAGLFLGFLYRRGLSRTLKINFALCAVALVAVMGWLGGKNRQLDEVYLGTDYEVATVYDKLGWSTAAGHIRSRCAQYYEQGGYGG
jgi:membrane associated rhomboid family serine protease